MGIARILKSRGCFVEGSILGKGKVVAVRGGEGGMWGGCLTRRGEGTKRRPSTVGSSIGRRQHRLATELENNMYSKGECVCVWDEVLLAKIRESSWFLVCCVSLLAVESKCFVWSAACFLYNSLPVGRKVFAFWRDNSTDYKREQTPCRLCTVKIVLRCVCLLIPKEGSHLYRVT